MLTDVASTRDEPVLALDCRNHLGESILWDERRQSLVWVDIHVGNVWVWSPSNSASPVRFDVGARVGAIALTTRCDGLLALEAGFARIDLETGKISERIDFERPAPSVRLNDGRVDPVGRFICGGMDEADPQRPIARVYALDPTGHRTTLLDGIHCANSTCWSPDGRTFYFSDMATRRIDAYDYDVETGAIANKRIFANLGSEPGLPDGSTVDAEGYLWNAQWGGSKIVRFAPDGSVDREVTLPTTNPTCLTFGGPDLDLLFITSAQFGLDAATLAAEPQAGSVFVMKPGVAGCLEHRYAG